MGAKNFTPYEFTTQASKPDQEAKLIALGNSLGLKFQQIYALTVTEPTQPVPAPYVPAGLLWGELIDPKTKGRLAIALETNLLQAMIAKKLGGHFAAGIDPQPQGLLGEQLSRKELAKVLQEVANFVFGYTKSQWTTRVLSQGQAPDLPKLETFVLRFTHIEAPREKFALYFSCETRLARELVGQRPSPKGQTASRDGIAILQQLRTSKVELRVILGERRLSLREICQLEVGQILMLDTHKSDSVDILVEKKPLFKAKLGLRNKRFILKLV